jgi:hypothetical protein
MAFDQMPGVVLVLDGRPVGEAWYSKIDRARTSHGIRVECAKNPRWWGSRQPILVFSRPVRGTEVSALKACGLDFRTDYRQLKAPKKLTLGVLVFVPTSEAPEETR